jgi:hypothetical protein
MPVPKAAMDKDNHSPLGKHQIGTTSEVSTVKPEPETSRM